MRMFNISASVGCHKGNKRKNNEDNFYLNGEFKEDPNEKKNLFFNINTNDKIQVYAVCDGMGGGDLGEIASYIAVKILSKYQKEVFNYSGRITIEKHIDEYIEDVNERICEVTSKLNKDVSFIVDNSLLKGGIDNITALLIEIEGSKNEKANKVIRCILLLTFLVITIIGINLLY